MQGGRVVRKSKHCKHCFFVGYSLIVDIIITLSRDRRLSQLYCVALQQFAQVVIFPTACRLLAIRKSLSGLCDAKQEAMYGHWHTHHCMVCVVVVGGDFVCHGRRFILFDALLCMSYMKVLL